MNGKEKFEKIDSIANALKDHMDLEKNEAIILIGTIQDNDDETRLHAANLTMGSTRTIARALAELMKKEEKFHRIMHEAMDIFHQENNPIEKLMDALFSASTHEEFTEVLKTFEKKTSDADTTFEGLLKHLRS